MAKPEIDLAVVMGGKGKHNGTAPKPPMSMGDDEGDMEGMGAEGAAEEELPPGFAEAAEEFLDAGRPMEERQRALYRAVKACSASY